MSFEIPDVDIDVADRDIAISVLRNVVYGSQLNNAKNELIKHNTGIYLQNVPVDPISLLTSFPYDVAEEFGYYKIDLIPNHIYEGIENERHLKEIIDLPIDWDWFLDTNFTRSLFHFGGMVTADLSMAEVVLYYAPKSIEDLACLVAIKLPAKRYLIGQTWDIIHNKIWLKEEGKMFKKSHGFAYALAITIDAKMKINDRI